MTGWLWFRLSVLGVILAGTLGMVTWVGSPEGNPVRIEGAAPKVSRVRAAGEAAEPSPPEAPPSAAVEAAPPEEAPSPVPGVPAEKAVALLRADRMNTGGREILACDGRSGGYPVDVHLAALTDSSPTDLVINVTTCGDGIGIASYVYRSVRGDYVNVFRAEDTSVWAKAAGNGLQVIRQDYAEDDPVYGPSGETVTMYRWDGSAFVLTSLEKRNHGK
ncbi:hypothetical protein AQ490_22510 [Wenjunlia vitaminophila]|uniref:Lipoprotein CseA n=1 Tax=Wenjunlia vitaminophila TaxID=76728 RepID=A0A0T6LS40_WENVI|nr:hypothetical protein [Wenjunlia vitaminophila]KRV48909.1 hypothetical protein AQ490_22510 [Wenjunlia vitaminophila]